MSFERVYSTFDLQQQALLVSLLEADSIRYVIENSWSGAQMYAGGIHFKVHKDDVDQAKAIITQFEINDRKE